MTPHARSEATSKTNYYDGSTLARNGYGLLDGSRRTDGDKHIISAAPTGQRRNCFANVYLVASNDVSGAELLRVIEFLVTDIDGDDRRCARHPGTLDRIEPNPSGTDNDHARTGSHVGGVGHGAEARDDAAREERSDVETHRVVNARDLRVMDDCSLGESAGVHALDDIVAVGIVQPMLGCNSETASTLAQVRLVPLTEEAVTAIAQ